MANPIVHFEIPADDVARARSFYERTFGWKIKAYPMPPGSDEYYGVTTKDKAQGIDGGLMKRKMPDQPFMNYVTVKSIDEFNQKIGANGGMVVMPKKEIGPSMGWISAFRDPEGNVMGLHQMPATMPKKAAAKKPKAKKAAKKKKRR
jgi:predicted enzyme related to lactoylglutathione lyase